MKTATVGIREAKTHLSRYLKIVSQGAEVILTDRGVPVGKIVPVPSGELPLAQRLRRLEETGILGGQPARSKGKTGQAFPFAVPGDTAQRFLQEDRGNG